MLERWDEEVGSERLWLAPRLPPGTAFPSDALAAAYGIAVAGTMMVTTILLYHLAVARWHWPPVVSAIVIALFAGMKKYRDAHARAHAGHSHVPR